MSGGLAGRRWWPAIAVLAIGVQVAHADKKPIVAINGMVAISGRATERDLGVVGGAVETAARHAGWSLPVAPLPRKIADGIVHCATAAEPWKCAPAVIDARDIRRALLIVAEPEQTEGGIPMLVLTGRLVVNSPAALLVHQRFCQQCADDRLAAESADLAAQLLNELAVRTGRTMIRVRSVPTGAIVAIDELPSGTTDRLFNTFPGPHSVSIRRTGYDSEIVSVDAEDGKTTDVSVALRPAAGSPSAELAGPVDGQPRRAWLGPAAVFTGAGALLGMSGYSLYRGFVGDAKYVYPRARALGLITGALGLTAIAGGVYWLRVESASPAAAVSGNYKSGSGSSTQVVVGLSKTF